jgi:hypothetical protein
MLLIVICFFRSVEVAGLDRYVNDFFNKQTDGYQSIHFPECPRCRTTIRHCQRYIAITNRIQSWIEQIKIKQQNDITTAELITQRDQLLKTLKYSFEKIKSIEQKCFETFIRRFNGKKQSINIDEINYLKNTCEFFKEIK